MTRQEGQLYIDQMVAMLSRENPNDVGQLLRDTRSLAEHWGVQFPNETVVTDMREEINLNSPIERESESTSGTSSPNAVEARLRNVEASIQRYRDARTSTRNMASNIKSVMSLSRNERLQRAGLNKESRGATPLSVANQYQTMAPRPMYPPVNIPFIDVDNRRRTRSTSPIMTGVYTRTASPVGPWPMTPPEPRILQILQSITEREIPAWE